MRRVSATRAMLAADLASIAATGLVSRLGLPGRDGAEIQQVARDSAVSGVVSVLPPAAAVLLHGPAQRSDRPRRAGLLALVAAGMGIHAVWSGRIVAGASAGRPRRAATAYFLVGISLGLGYLVSISGDRRLR